ncbi:hypothetical protein LCGC14_1597590 [marine sediment metagenome]|uniref:Uncharacterized protein n=1 Tax=marine sediment metagenome TaxID=412755 RepID=A0A0F9IC30_9ZZZZ
MLTSSPLVKLLKALSREDPERVARCKEVIQDLLELGDYHCVSIEEIALALDKLDDLEN